MYVYFLIIKSGINEARLHEKRHTIMKNKSIFKIIPAIERAL